MLVGCVESKMKAAFTVMVILLLSAVFLPGQVPAVNPPPSAPKSLLTLTIYAFNMNRPKRKPAVYMVVVLAIVLAFPLGLVPIAGTLPPPASVQSNAHHSQDSHPAPVNSEY